MSPDSEVRCVCSPPGSACLPPRPAPSWSPTTFPALGDPTRRRIAGPGPGRSRSPPPQRIEHTFERGSGTLHSLMGQPVPAGAVPGSRDSPEPQAQQRTAEDSRGHQRTPNLEVSGHSERLTWAANHRSELHTARITGSCKASQGLKPTAAITASWNPCSPQVRGSCRGGGRSKPG
jgi:hypothetical protein